MPIYEYACMTCESHFEELVRNDEAVLCPDCGAGNVLKQLSKFAVAGASSQPSFGGAAGGGCCGGGCGCG
jgi:putative FmdB family regulatory protein